MPAKAILPCDHVVDDTAPDAAPIADDCQVVSILHAFPSIHAGDIHRRFVLPTLIVPSPPSAATTASTSTSSISSHRDDSSPPSPPLLDDTVHSFSLPPPPAVSAAPVITANALTPIVPSSPPSSIPQPMTSPTQAKKRRMKKTRKLAPSPCTVNIKPAIIIPHQQQSDHIAIDIVQDFTVPPVPRPIIREMKLLICMCVHTMIHTILVVAFVIDVIAEYYNDTTNTTRHDWMTIVSCLFVLWCISLLKRLYTMKQYGSITLAPSLGRGVWRAWILWQDFITSSLLWFILSLVATRNNQYLQHFAICLLLGISATLNALLLAIIHFHITS